MDFAATYNESLGMNSSQPDPEVVGSLHIGLDTLRSPTTILFSVLLAYILGVVIYLSHTPAIDKRSPALTADTLPLVGSWAFFSRRLKFWNTAVKHTKTGNFSFWLGRNHVVAVSGEAARKMYLDNRHLDFIHGNRTLLGLGPDFGPIQEIQIPGPRNGPSFLQRRLIDLMKADQLGHRLHTVVADSRNAMIALEKDTAAIVNPFSACYPVVVSQSCRVNCSDELADTPELLQKCLQYLTMFASTSDRHTAALPYVPSWESLKRWYCRRGLHTLVAYVVDRRLDKITPPTNDALQMFVDNKDPRGHMIDFFISMLFIATANAGVLNGLMLNVMAHAPFWQDKIYGEIKAACVAHSANQELPLVEQLGLLPLDVWESAFPSIDLCFKEAIRVYAAFPMYRKNMSTEPLPIPGTHEVIPPGSFVAYNTTDVHYNEAIYPNPTKFDPERFSAGREEFNRQTYGFVGWGHGRHPCLGQRWAKLQQTIILAHALAMYEWSGCDITGQPVPPMDPPKDVDVPTPSLPQGIYCKYTARK